ncbi:hypothetical protein [Rufibacter quisquiliarum]|uniref:Uncharacterized protein n=1 Tax=Rufibacter quisquiliarum TaxID=1549639 RepID=A0A839GHE6_9BACT|nr:hypothetical protein [Rufibacter quisquiliarum]MBA9076119.1 hypothetical protein [Rufibacter quisquiliarum]
MAQREENQRMISLWHHCVFKLISEKEAKNGDSLLKSISAGAFA